MPIAIFVATLTCIIIQRLPPTVFLVQDGSEVNGTPQGKPGGSDVFSLVVKRHLQMRLVHSQDQDCQMQHLL